MKKSFILFTIVAITLSMSVTAFAADVPTYEDINISGVVEQNENIHVEMNWTDMSFIYKVNEYDPDTELTKSYWDWEEGSNVITIQNHSTIALNFEFTFNADSSWGGSLMFSGDEGEPSINSYSVTVDTADSANVYVMPAENASAIETDTKMGTMSVEITRAT